MSKSTKVLALAGSATAAVIAGVVGIPGDIVEASSVTPATATVQDGKIVLSWDKTLEGPFTIKMVDQSGATKVLDTVSDKHTYDFILSGATAAAFNDITKDGMFTKVATAPNADKDVELTITPEAALELANNFSFIVENGTGYSEPIPVSHTTTADEILFKVVNGNDLSSSVSNWSKVSASTLIKVKDVEVPNKTVIFKIKDTESGAETAEVRVKMSEFSSTTGIAEIKNIKPVITVSEELTSKTVDVAFSLPTDWKDVDAKIFYTLNDSKPILYEAGTNVTLTDNARIEAFIVDAYGEKSAYAQKSVNNVNSSFGEEYKLDLKTDMLTIIKPEGIENILRYEYSLNGSSFRIYNSPVKVAEGVHELQVRVVYVDGSISEPTKHEYRVGAGNQKPTEEDEKSEAYKKLKAEAEKLVAQAELDKTQASVDAASKSLEGLTFTDRLIFEQRLNVVRSTLNTTSAALAVETLKTTPNLVNLIDATKKVNNLADGDVKKLLNEEIKKYNAPIFKDAKTADVKTAMDAFIKTIETNPTKGDLEALSLLTAEITDSTLKTAYQAKYTELKNKVDFAQAFTDAEKALADAEKAQTKTAYNKAKDLIDKLPASDKTTDMKKRLALLEKIVGVTSSEVFDKIVKGDKVTDLELAKGLDMDLPSSVIPKITESIKNLGDHASTINAQKVAELHIALDKAQRSLSAKSIEEYAKVYNSYKDLATIKTFSEPKLLELINTSMSDNLSYDAVVKAMADMTGIDATKLANYYKVVPTATDSKAAILTFEEISKLEKVYEHKMFKAMLLTTEFLVEKSEINKTGALTAIGSLMNGEYKQAMLTTMGASADDIKKAGEREDTVIKKDGKTEEEKAEQDTELNKYLATLDKDVKFESATVKDPKAGESITLKTESGHFITLIAGTGVTDYTFMVVPEGENFIVKLFENGKEVKEFKEKVKVGIADNNKGAEAVRVNADGTLSYLSAKVVSGAHQFDVKSLPLTMKLNTNTGKHSDVVGDWSQVYVQDLVRKGVIQDSFAYFPKDNISRGEFAHFLAMTLGLDIPETTTFTDTAGSPYAGAIEALRAAGIVQGSGENKFNPNQSLTRQQSALMLTRAMSHKGMNTQASGAPSFADTKKISTGALNSVAYLQQAGIFTGAPNHKGTSDFLPTQNLTKGQMAKILSISIGHMHLAN